MLMNCRTFTQKCKQTLEARQLKCLAQGQNNNNLSLYILFIYYSLKNETALVKIVKTATFVLKIPKRPSREKWSLIKPHVKSPLYLVQLVGDRGHTWSTTWSHINTWTVADLPRFTKPSWAFPLEFFPLAQLRSESLSGANNDVVTLAHLDTHRTPQFSTIRSVQFTSNLLMCFFASIFFSLLLVS